MADAYRFDLAGMTPEARALWLDVYTLGYCDGIDAGRRQVDAELVGEWAALRAAVMPSALAEPFDALADRRGQHERAEAHRALLRDRRVMA